MSYAYPWMLQFYNHFQNVDNLIFHFLNYASMFYLVLDSDKTFFALREHR